MISHKKTAIYADAYIDDFPDEGELRERLTNLILDKARQRFSSFGEVQFSKYRGQWGNVTRATVSGVEHG